ncbi:MAG: DUF418 domain-containing protein [Planctomycetota bacterium]
MADPVYAPRPPLAPTPDEARILAWDLMRGIAVLGILVANIPGMSLARWLVEADPSKVGTSSRIDWLAFVLVRVLADSKFMTAFSLLFGAGLALLHCKATTRGRGFGEVVSRRLVALFGVGVLHGTLIWFGDILTGYALVAPAALPFVRRRSRTLVIWAIALLLLSLLAMVAIYSMDPDRWVERRKDANGTVLSVEESRALETAEIAEVYSSGDFRRMLSPRVNWYVFGTLSYITVYGPRTLALFLLGIAAVRSRVAVDVADHRRFWRRLLWIGLGLGVPLHALHLAIGSATPSARMIAEFALYVGSLCQCLGYCGVAALWSLGSPLMGLKSRLAAVGRMAFTNYIAQSVITAIVFNYLGFYDRLGRTEGLLLACAILALQVAWSRPWLARFRMGPLEWLWRAFTYWRFTPLRRFVQTT